MKAGVPDPIHTYTDTHVQRYIELTLLTASPFRHHSRAGCCDKLSTLVSLYFHFAMLHMKQQNKHAPLAKEIYFFISWFGVKGPSYYEGLYRT